MFFSLSSWCFAIYSLFHTDLTYHQVSSIRCTWVGNDIVDHSDVVRASPVGAAPPTSSFSTEHLGSIYCAKTTASQVEKHFKFWDLVRLILDISRYVPTLHKIGPVAASGSVVAYMGAILTHWGWDEMNNISQTTFSNVFSSMKMFELWLKFHWSFFPRVQLTIFQHRFR